jgi:phage terminase large subunit-like protein
LTVKALEQVSEIRAVLRAEQSRRITENRLAHYRPYPKQREFHRAGATCRERLLMAGNQLGKTTSGAAETAIHLTGRYPDWWDGRVLEGTIHALAGSESAELTRDGVQRLLVGPPRDESLWGTGLIPKECLVDWSRKQGVPDALDGILVRHGGGGDVQAGHSTLNFKSYDQGRTKWQADKLRVVWFDEEPPLDIYTEGLTRTNVGEGPVYLTFTPLQGMSDTVRRFLLERSDGRHVTSMTIEDAEHFSPEERARIVASYPAHERDARTKGIPQLGSGRIFPVLEEPITCPRREIPKYWRRLGAMDFGWDHPFAAVELAHDLDHDTVYVTKTYRVREATPVMHAAALKPWGKAVGMAARWQPRDVGGGGYCARRAVPQARLEHAAHSCAVRA